MIGMRAKGKVERRRMLLPPADSTDHIHRMGARPMMKKALAVAALSAMFANPAWALFETNKELIATAKITLEEAVRHALKSVPGKAVEAEIGKEDGRTVYEVEIIDQSNKTQKVYVDAQSGQTKVHK